MKLPTTLVQQARQAAQPQRRSVAGQIEARFVAAETSGRLAQAVRDTVVSHRQRAKVPRRKAA